MPDGMTLTDFLIWLFSAGGAAVAVSFITERIPAFQALSSSTRSTIHLFGSLGIALGAYAVMTFVPETILAGLVPWFQIVAGVTGAWILNQLGHRADPAAERNKTRVSVSVPASTVAALSTDELQRYVAASAVSGGQTVTVEVDAEKAAEVSPLSEDARDKPLGTLTADEWDERVEAGRRAAGSGGEEGLG